MTMMLLFGSSSRMMMIIMIVVSSYCMTHVTAEKDSNPYPWGENPNNRFNMYWNDARNVLQDLDEFSSLFIKYHGCVWSECSIDNYDDDGEGRDGDEYWYQYRTQPFCANAAFSLYGIRKNTLHLPWNQCSRSTYINSFFTYGGADTVTEALQIATKTVFSSYNNNDNDNNNDDDDTTHPNAVCYAIEQENQDDDSGISSTMGCSNKGRFVGANFHGQTCDGNFYLETFDDMNSYNRALNRVHCRQIWSRRRDRKQVPDYNEYYNRDQNNNNNNNNRRQLEDQQNNNDDSYQDISVPAWKILTSSWACDVDLYPRGCPDPYGLKKRYNNILHAVSSGHNPELAFWHQRLKSPLRITAAIFLVVSVGLFGSAYYLSRRIAMKNDGVMSVLWQDFKEFCYKSGVFCRKLCKKCWMVATGRARRRRKKKKRKSSKKKKNSELEEELSPKSSSSHPFSVFT